MLRCVAVRCVVLYCIVLHFIVVFRIVLHITRICIILNPFLAKYWETKENRNNFFNDFARDNHFEPLIATNWYQISKTKLLQKKVDRHFHRFNRL